MQPPDAASTTIVDAGVYSAPRLRSEWATLRYRHPGELEGSWYAFKASYGKGCVHFFYEEATVTNVESATADKVRVDQAGADAASVDRLRRASLHLLSGQHLDISPARNLVPNNGHVTVPLALINFRQCGGDLL